MQHLQIINHRGQLAAAVIAGTAIIEDTLPDEDFRHVQAMCLYAMEIGDRERPGPYTDSDADAYARAAAAAAGQATASAARGKPTPVDTVDARPSRWSAL